MGNIRRSGAALGAGLLAVVSVGSVSAQDLTSVSVQLQWVPQAQFAGYFAALEQGFWEKRGLDVTILEGGPDVFPQVVGSDANGPEFTTSWVPKVLEHRQNAGSTLVNIAQLFQRSGTLSLSWAPGKGPDPVSDASITSPADFEGKRVSAWLGGNEWEVVAAARKAGLDLGPEDLISQPFDMSLLLTRQTDVAEAMIYNEYAQVLETVNPKTGELYQPEDLNVIDYNEVGTAMLQDAIWARSDWLEQEGSEDIATRFLAGAFEGWMYCRDNPEACVQSVLAAGPTLGEGHQRWMMNEVNALIWPAEGGIGAMPVDTWDTTVDISVEAGIISQPPDEGAYRTDLAQAARALIEGDTTGEGFAKGTVEVTEGGN